MNTLDNFDQIKKFDTAKVLESTEMLGGQINSAWQEFKKVKLPKSFSGVDNIVINGMGGSALGGHVLRSVFFDELKLPFDIINSYQVPASVNKNTLYVISSYSGTTEEPLSTLVAVKKRGAKIFGISGGGQLGHLIKQGKIAGYVFDPIFNPSAQPRLGLGYSLAAQLGLLKKLGLVKIDDSQLKGYIVNLNRLQAKFGIANKTSNNPAKKLALQMQNKTPILIASEFLAGNAHVFANQINETAKNFANYFLLPEIGHHLIEGLVFPKTNSQNLFFIFFKSKLYHPSNQLRYKITEKIISQNKIKFFSYQLAATDKAGQALEMLLFGSYVSFYLAILNKVDPSKIPWVDYLKAELKKSR